jgi:hypothetical protein
VKFLLARHSFVQLRVWETELRDLYPKLGVHTAGIDERNNRLDIAVTDAVHLSSLKQQLTTNLVPDDAIVTRVGPIGAAFAQLTDKIRPARGGLYILTLFTYAGVNYRYFCTYGFNTLINSVRYMVTAAHCVEPETTWGGLIGATVAQPDSNPSSLVGSVTKNPASFAGTGCAVGNTCRYSDAVLVSTTGLGLLNWDLGHIARTITRATGPNSGSSITINSTTPTIALSGSSIFFVGDTLDKIGTTSGWTAGVVTNSCTYHAVGTFGRICDGVVAAGANNGDSGSPVFWFNGTHYYLMGILWGGAGNTQFINSSEFWFSSFTNIKSDLSPTQPMAVN